MMTIYKVLELSNNGEYVKLEERHESASTDFYPCSESRHTVTLKEGGMMINVVFMIIKI